MREVNVKNLSDTVMKLVMKTGEGQENYQDAIASFFEEIQEEWDIESFIDLEKRIGPIFRNVFIAFLHYFLSTTFCD